MTSSDLETRHCEVCGGRDLHTVLDLGSHPMCDDLVRIGEDRVCKNYPIEILFCDTCRTAHQRFQIPKHDLFPSTYHYRSRHTADVLNGMRDLVAATTSFRGSLEGTKVLDVGCNDGSLLSIFREGGASTFGIEPTGAASDAAAAGHIVLNSFFDEEVAQTFKDRFGSPDLITFTNVFAHIEDLQAVIRALRIVMHPGTVVVIENHYLGAILDKRQFDTFYHEHPRTYSYRSFAFIADALGLTIAQAQFPARYGGNIRVFLAPTARSSSEPPAFHADIDKREASYGQGLLELSAQIVRWKARKSEEIESAVRAFGPLNGKAFPGRAAIPIKMLGLDDTQIAAVYEKPASGKIGHYIPGTRIPISSDNDFVPSPEGQPLVNMAWHIAPEIALYMRDRGYRGPIIDIIASKDFDV